MSREGPSLPEIAAILKAELNLPPETSTATVVDRACRDLEVQMEGLSLVAKAHECWKVMGKPQPPLLQELVAERAPPPPLGQSSSSIDDPVERQAVATARLAAAARLVAKTEAEAAAARMEAEAARAEALAAAQGGELGALAAPLAEVAAQVASALAIPVGVAPPMAAAPAPSAATAAAGVGMGGVGNESPGDSMLGIYELEDQLPGWPTRWESDLDFELCSNASANGAGVSPPDGGLALGAFAQMCGMAAPAAPVSSSFPQQATPFNPPPGGYDGSVTAATPAPTVQAHAICNYNTSGVLADSKLPRPCTSE
jgi:hypothetical protein